MTMAAGEFSVFDLFFDLPHPAASPGCQRSRVITPPVSLNTGSKSVAQELYESHNISRITRFAFPEHDDQLHTANMSFKQAVLEAMKDNASKTSSGAGLNKHDVYFYSFAPQHHTFALQLSSGVRIYGHVRRYLPPHDNASSRIDVGRRGARAMVLLTRAPGGERFYKSVLKTIEAITTLQAGTHSSLHSHINPQQAFLFSLQKRQHQICTDHAVLHSRLNFQTIGPNSNTTIDADAVHNSSHNFVFQSEHTTDIVINGTEFGDGSLLQNLDCLRFTLPPSLQPGYVGMYTTDDINSPIVPLLRCLGVSHTIRLLSALLCERRIIMISKSTSRLSSCINATSSILAQGLLVWQHVFVSVLPPHLLKYLAAETPYLIGVLERHAFNLEMIPGILDVLCINLDSNTMQTYNMTDPSVSIPDLLLPVKRKKAETIISCSDLLAQDLNEVIKADKRMWAEKITRIEKVPEPQSSNTTSSTSKGGRKGNRKNTSSFNLFAKKKKPIVADHHHPSSHHANPQINSKTAVAKECNAVTFGMLMRSHNDEDDAASVLEDNAIPSSAAAAPQELVRGDSGMIDSDCCENETAEEGARVALVTFFLYVYGDMGMFLSESTTDIPNNRLTFDRRKFLMCKTLTGEEEHTPMYRVLQNFSKSAMFRRFVKRRIVELELPLEEKKKCLTHHKSLFSLCETYMRVKGLEWTLENIRPVIQKIAQSSPRRKMALWSDDVRKKTLSLTSNQDFTGNALKALAELIDYCCEINGALCHIMGAIWTRLQDGRQSMWRHRLLALYVLRNILLHGPLPAITEISDGIDKIRALKIYSTSRNTFQEEEVRSAAADVYELLVDRTVLFSERRHLACKRSKLLSDAAPKTNAARWEDYLIRRLPMWNTSFDTLHALLRPKEYDPTNTTRGGRPLPKDRTTAGIRQNDANSNSKQQHRRRSSKQTTKQQTQPHVSQAHPVMWSSTNPEADADIQNLVHLFNTSMDKTFPTPPPQTQSQTISEEYTSFTVEDDTNEWRPPRCVKYSSEHVVSETGGESIDEPTPSLASSSIPPHRAFGRGTDKRQFAVEAYPTVQKEYAVYKSGRHLKEDMSVDSEQQQQGSYPKVSPGHAVYSMKPTKA